MSMLVPLLCAFTAFRSADSVGSPQEIAPPRGFDVQGWMARWQRNILGDSRNRYCDKETGEEIGWLVSPFLDGYYEGFRATRDVQWIDRLVDWTDALLARTVREPDGYVGWPKSGSGGVTEQGLKTDSLLGEAMAMRPIVLLSGEILHDARLRGKYGVKADGYLRFAEQLFAKWNARDCWRNVGDGGVWVAPDFGIDPATGQWTPAYAERKTQGFTDPDNKENLIAEWMTAMYDVTRKPVYRDRAERWWRVMHSRMQLREGGKYFVWNYWEPAGPWDHKPDGSLRHWVGVHPNGGYYAIDAGAIVDAYRHGLVFTKADIDRLLTTNRDFMWNQSLETPKFRRIDGGEADPRWKDSPGVLWSGLLPYDPTLRQIFAQTTDPASWSALAAAPAFVAMLNNR